MTLKLWTIVPILLMIMGIVFLVLCLTTDTHDQLYLTIALGATALGNFSNFFIHKKRS